MSIHAMRTIPVLALEFVEGGNTIWVQGIDGTVLRIKVTGKITTTKCSMERTSSHADMFSAGSVEFCLGDDEGKEIPWTAVKSIQKHFEKQRQTSQRSASSSPRKEKTKKALRLVSITSK